MRQRDPGARTEGAQRPSALLSGRTQEIIRNRDPSPTPRRPHTSGGLSVCLEEVLSSRVEHSHRPNASISRLRPFSGKATGRPPPAAAVPLPHLGVVLVADCWSDQYSFAVQPAKERAFLRTEQQKERQLLRRMADGNDASDALAPLPSDLLSKEPFLQFLAAKASEARAAEYHSRSLKSSVAGSPSPRGDYPHAIPPRSPSARSRESPASATGRSARSQNLSSPSPRGLPATGVRGVMVRRSETVGQRTRLAQHEAQLRCLRVRLERLQGAVGDDDNDRDLARQVDVQLAAVEEQEARVRRLLTATTVAEPSAHVARHHARLRDLQLTAWRQLLDTMAHHVQAQELFADRAKERAKTAVRTRPQSRILPTPVPSPNAPPPPPLQPLASIIEVARLPLSPHI
eukprot:TRINITY_DN14880_c0_g1_i1.p1 TRINITY_DN14880_c0_g1~~TRINITY_DN14880_c0_g1_i1.p1  ORF type:complete len:428 (-),score=45.95 TRINITY_DN14880_c0_g1_i1:76-1281(-)